MTLTRPVEIKNYAQFSSPKVVDQIKEIFFTSSNRQVFSSPLAREAFWQRWTEYYFAEQPQLIWIALHETSVVGYLMGCTDSLAACTQIGEKLPSYLVFRDLFEIFPAHLHMNTSPQYRSQGIGKKLLTTFVRHLETLASPGLHIVTSPKESNVQFYKRELFTFNKLGNFKNYELLFMGRRL